MPGWIFSGYRRPEHLTTPQPQPAPPAATTAATPKPAAEPLPTLNMTGAAHMTGGCTCLAIYSRCHCHLRKRTAP